MPDAPSLPLARTSSKREFRTGCQIAARTLKFLGKREGNGGAPIGRPPPEGYEDSDDLPL